MSKGIEELLELLKSEVGVDEVPGDLKEKINKVWPDTGDLFTQEEVDEIVQQRLARERKAHESEIEELESKLKERVPAEEKEEAEKEAEKVKKQAQKRVAEFAKEKTLEAEAVKAGVRQEAVEDFVKIVDKDELKFEDDEVKGIDPLIETIKEEKPYFFEPEDEGSAGGSDFSGEGEGDNYFTKEQVENMSQEEVMEHYDDIKKSEEKWD